jgi:hypothetical protein
MGNTGRHTLVLHQPLVARQRPQAPVPQRGNVYIGRDQPHVHVPRPPVEQRPTKPLLTKEDRQAFEVRHFAHIPTSLDPTALDRTSPLFSADMERKLFDNKPTLLGNPDKAFGWIPDDYGEKPRQAK